MAPLREHLGRARLGAVAIAVFDHDLPPSLALRSFVLFKKTARTSCSSRLRCSRLAPSDLAVARRGRGCGGCRGRGARKSLHNVWFSTSARGDTITLCSARCPCPVLGKCVHACLFEPAAQLSTEMPTLHAISITFLLYQTSISLQIRLNP